MGLALSYLYHISWVFPTQMVSFDICPHCTLKLMWPIGPRSPCRLVIPQTLGKITPEPANSSSLSVGDTPAGTCLPQSWIWQAELPSESSKHPHEVAECKFCWSHIAPSLPLAFIPRKGMLLQSLQNVFHSACRHDWVTKALS